MTNEAPAPSSFDDLNRRIHRAFLVAIGISAIASLSAGFPSVEPTPGRAATMLAVMLGLSCVVLRRVATSPVVSPRAEVSLGALGLACGAGLALLGAAIAWQTDAGRTGLAYAGAAFIICIRPPTPSHLRVRRHRID